MSGAPPKFYMEPENDGFQTDFLFFSGDFFLGSMLNFGCVYFLVLFVRTTDVPFGHGSNQINGDRITW